MVAWQRSGTMVPEKFVPGPFKGDLPCRVDDIGQGAERKTTTYTQ